MPSARFDHVGVERPLNEEAWAAEARGLLLEHTDELLADDLSLSLRIGHAGEAREEALAGVDRHERNLEVVAEGGYDLIALVLAQQSVVDEDAGELVADR